MNATIGTRCLEVILSGVLLCGATGCGRTQADPPVQPASANASQNPSTEETRDADEQDGRSSSDRETNHDLVNRASTSPPPKTAKTTKASSVVVTVDQSPRAPATVEEAAKLLDLRTLKLFDGAEVLRERLQVGELYYRVQASLRDVLKYHLTQLKKSGWQVLPSSRINDTEPRILLTQDGYVAELYLSRVSYPPEKEGYVSVTLTNHGNILSRSLPKPAQVEVNYVDETAAMYITDRPAAEIRSESERLLHELGWEPYGVAADVRYFKRNAILLQVDVSTHESRPGKTFLSYHTRLLSADLPMPQQYDNPRYDDVRKRVTFDCPADDVDKVTAYYSTQLGKQGWEATGDPARIDEQTFVIYRNTGGDMIELSFRHFRDECSVTVAHSTATEIAAREQRMKEHARLAARAAVGEDPADIGETEPPESSELPSVTTDDSADEATATVEPGGIAASLIPIPDNAAKVQLDADLEMIIYRHDLSVDQLAEYYRTTFKKIGWRETTDETFLDAEENIGGITFASGERQLRIAIQPGQPESKSRVLIQGEAIIWPAGGDQLLQEDNEDPHGETNGPTSDEPTDAGNDDEIALRVTDVQLGTCQGYVQKNTKKFTLQHAVAFQTVEFGQPITVVYVSEKPFRTHRIKGTKVDDLMIFDCRAEGDPPAMEMRIAKEFVSISCFVEDASINISGANFRSEAVVKDGRLVGKVYSPKPHDFFDDTFQFSVELDVPLMTLAKAAAPVRLNSDPSYAYPVPADATDVESQSGPYRATISGKVNVELSVLVAFYQAQLEEDGWKLNPNDTTSTNKRPASRLAAQRDGEVITIDLQQSQQLATFHLEARDEAQAKKDGMLAKPGQGRVVLGNGTAAEIVVVIDGKEHHVDAGVGGRDPADAVKLDLAPGKHVVVIRVGGVAVRTENIELQAGATWGFVAFADETFFARRLY